MRKTFGLLVAAGLLIGFGNVTANKPVEYRDRDVPGKTVHEVETVTNEVRYVPESCKIAMDLSTRRAKAAVVIDNASTEQLEIISAARRELASTNQLNDLETQLRLLQGRVVAAVLEMSNTDKQYAEAYATCVKETK